MKRCPSCNRTYTDASLNFCLEDGTPLVNEAAPGGDPNATIRYDIRDTNPPKTEIYPSFPPASSPPAAGSQPPASRPPVPAAKPAPWAPPPASVPSAIPRKKSNAILWIVGGGVIVGIIAIGLIVMLIVLASMNSNSNNSNSNANSRLANRNTNTNTNLNSNVANINSDANLPPLVTDDFSAAKWGTGNYDYGDIWYDNDEYHMRAKEKTYLLMYGPDDYNTSNANVKVTVRSVDGTASPTGYGLVVHGERSKAGELEDYALLIYTGADPQY
jgi:hypothetical protein